MGQSYDIELTFNEYAKLAKRTQGHVGKAEERLKCAALGLSGEAGEFADLIKKVFYHGIDLPREKALKELGDVLWYVRSAAEALDSSLEDIARMNIAKLEKRYPQGFSTEASLAKADEVSESQILRVEKYDGPWFG